MIVSLLSAPVPEEIVLETLIIIEPRQISLSTHTLQSAYETTTHETSILTAVTKSI